MAMLVLALSLIGTSVSIHPVAMTYDDKMVVDCGNYMEVHTFDGMTEREQQARNILYINDEYFCVLG